MFTRYEDAEKALGAAQGNLHQKEKKMEQIESFIAEVEALPYCITEFRTDYWGHLVEKVTVHRNGAMTFTLSFGWRLRFESTAALLGNGCYCSRPHR
jgi:hypothetical protein